MEKPLRYGLSPDSTKGGNYHPNRHLSTYSVSHYGANQSSLPQTNGMRRHNSPLTPNFLCLPSLVLQSGGRDIHGGCRDRRFGTKVSQIDPKWDKSGSFSDQITEHFGAPCSEILYEKVPDLSYFGSI